MASNMPRKTQVALDQYFPGALTGAETEQTVYKTLAPMGFNADNTLFADCSCPDEINHDDPEEDVSMLFQRRWGEVFPLSGLGGMPFVGKTGWAAMSSHVPVDGHILVLIGPHVGIDKDGNVGKVTRKGQHGSSSACGAAIGALAALEADRSAANFKNGYEDHQMDAIKHFLEPHVDELQETDNKQAALAYKMYDIAMDFLERIIHLNWMGNGSKLVIVGGIMINCDEEGSDRFLPLKFISRTQTREVDHFRKAFGESQRPYIFEQTRQ